VVIVRQHTHGVDIAFDGAGRIPGKLQVFLHPSSQLGHGSFSFSRDIRPVAVMLSGCKKNSPPGNKKSSPRRDCLMRSLPCYLRIL
jgi:hypothetical protein